MQRLDQEVICTTTEGREVAERVWQIVMQGATALEETEIEVDHWAALPGPTASLSLISFVSLAANGPQQRTEPTPELSDVDRQKDRLIYTDPGIGRKIDR